MSKKFYKDIAKHVEIIKETYGVESIEIDANHDHPQMICKMLNTGIKIVCMGLPNTTGTEAKHAAQNALKRVREGSKLGKSVVAYAGGKN